MRTQLCSTWLPPAGHSRTERCVEPAATQVLLQPETLVTWLSTLTRLPVLNWPLNPLPRPREGRMLRGEGKAGHKVANCSAKAE